MFAGGSGGDTGERGGDTVGRRRVAQGEGGDPREKEVTKGERGGDTGGKRRMAQGRRR